MPQAHVHDVLDMINSTGKPYSSATLQEAIIETFGEQMRFSSCSIDDMDSAQAVEFLVARGKFVPEKAGACCGACGG